MSKAIKHMQCPFGVLIVAKCIVNLKMYLIKTFGIKVLIVAKCIVNINANGFDVDFNIVLIVAKCIVNNKRG